MESHRQNNNPLVPKYYNSNNYYEQRYRSHLPLSRQQHRSIQESNINESSSGQEPNTPEYDSSYKQQQQQLYYSHQHHRPQHQQQQSPPNNVDVYKVHFKCTKGDYLLSDTLLIKPGDFVKVEAERGCFDVGVIFKKKDMTNPGVNTPQKRILSHISTDEMSMLPRKIAEETQATRICRQMVAQRGLPLTIADVEFQFDRNKLTVVYASDRRVDFRELVRDMFSFFGVRIWMQKVSPSEAMKLMQRAAAAADRKQQRGVVEAAVVVGGGASRGGEKDDDNDNVCGTSVTNNRKIASFSRPFDTEHQQSSLIRSSTDGDRPITSCSLPYDGWSKGNTICRFESNIGVPIWGEGGDKRTKAVNTSSPSCQQSSSFWTRDPFNNFPMQHAGYYDSGKHDYIHHFGSSNRCGALSVAGTSASSVSSSHAVQEHPSNHYYSLSLS